MVPHTIGAQSIYYGNDVKDTIVIEDVNCYWDEPRLRDCPYSNYTLSVPNSCQRGGGAGVRCRVIKNIYFSAAMINNSVLITWEYSNSKSRRPSSFDVHCFSEQQRYNASLSASSGTSRLSVGSFLPNTSYNCCVSAKYESITSEIRCVSIRSEDLLASTETFISSDTNTRTTVIIIGAVLGCITVILLLLLAVCGVALLYLLRSRTTVMVPKR